MLTNQFKKKIKSLQQLKFRQKYNKFIAEGPKICEEYLRSNKYSIQHIICQQEWYDINNELLKPFRGKTIISNERDLNFISSMKDANKILIVCDIPDGSIYNSSKLDGDWTIYLDSIRDPGNMGTIIRIADWFGVGNIISSKDSVDYYNHKVVQSAMGSHNRVELKISAFEELYQHFEYSYALTLEGDDIREVNTENRGLLVIGNESRGVQDEILKKVNNKINITGRGGAESLNAAVACGIACHQLIIN